jgi:predicted nucleotidyltransferase
LNILEDYLQNVKGIYLAGSYARNEQTTESDVDVLVVTNKIDKKIKRGKYELLLISEKSLKEALENNVLPILPMLREAKIFLNEELIENYKKTFLTKKNLKWHVETTKSALELNKKAIELHLEENKSISDNIVYSLILRLREIYLVECLINNKKYTTKNFLKLLRQLTNSVEMYKSYICSKNNHNAEKIVSVEEAKKVYDYILIKLKEQEKWIKRLPKNSLSP